MTHKPIINLYDSSGLGLILFYESGVLYSNQTGGLACLHPQVEGVFVPLIDELVDQEKLLVEYFIGPKWNECCWDGIDEETAATIDAILQMSAGSRKISVDRSRLRESHEAWIYVNVADTNDELDGPPISGFGSGKGVLTWPNSD